MPAVFRIVIRKSPVTVPYSDNIGSGAGIGQFGIPYRAPCQTFVCGRADVETLGRGAVVAHVGDQCPIGFFRYAWLDISRCHKRLTELPVIAAVISYGH